MESWRTQEGNGVGRDKIGANEIGPDDAVPFALTLEGAHGPVLAAANPAAREAGVQPGQRATDARGICPALRIAPADPAGQAITLRRLAHWAQRWSPLTATDGEDGLWIDMTGALHLAGGEGEAGERVFLADLRGRLRALGFSARAALAPTYGAAWALAHFTASGHPGGSGNDGVRGNRIEGDMLDGALAPLPVAALRLDPATVQLLERLGLKTIGALAVVPRLSLARRFRSGMAGADPLLRLDQALGREAEPMEALEVRPHPHALRRLLEPVAHVGQVRLVLGDLADDLCAVLALEQRGVRRLRLEGFRVDGTIDGVEVALAEPCCDPAHMARLFDGRLERMEAGFGFDAFALTALWHEHVAPEGRDYLRAGRPQAALARLIDRLSMRLGEEAVRRPQAVESHVPERSVRWERALQGLAPADAVPPSPQLPRPLRLLDRPEAISVLYATPEGPPRRFVWRRMVHDVVRHEGPERIAPEWWRERSTARLRDYYRVEDKQGRRYWIYRNGAIGDGRGGPPDWYLHGIFG